MNSYSFLDVQANILGPGVSQSIGNSAGPTKEGITISQTQDKNTMTIGADGQWMHSLHADRSGTFRLRLLKTSPVNAALQVAYDIQTVSSALHGQNIIKVSNTAGGDVVGCIGCAFKKFTDLTYSEDPLMNEWVFDCGQINYVLGIGTPDVNT